MSGMLIYMCKMTHTQTNIGLFPDVGGTFFLSGLPGELGVHGQQSPPTSALFNLSPLQPQPSSNPSPLPTPALFNPSPLPTSLCNAIWTWRGRPLAKRRP